MLDPGSRLDIIRSQGNKPGDEEVSQVSVALLALILPSLTPPFTVFLLRCQQEEWARQEKGVQGEASGATLRTQSMGRRPQAWCSPAADTAWVPPLAPQHQRAWLRR